MTCQAWNGIFSSSRHLIPYVFHHVWFGVHENMHTLIGMMFACVLIVYCDCLLVNICLFVLTPCLLDCIFVVWDLYIISEKTVGLIYLFGRVVCVCVCLYVCVYVPVWISLYACVCLIPKGNYVSVCLCL